MTDEARKRADRTHAAGMRLSEAGDEDAAIQQYLETLALDPDRPDTLYNLGLIYKYRGEWRAAFDCNARARRLRPKDEATLWNLAIAATALQDWRTARDVWQTLEILPAAGEGPINEDLGDTPVRINADKRTDAPTEVVWARRLCLVRARILNVPTGATGFRYGDVVLHDGAAMGYRLNSSRREVPVFNVLELFEPSRFSTFEASLEVDGQEDIEALDDRCKQAGIAFEHWTASVRNLCKACSEGRPHQGHDHELDQPDAWEKIHRVGLAAQAEGSVTALLKDWQGQGRRVADLRCTLDARLSIS